MNSETESMAEENSTEAISCTRRELLLLSGKGAERQEGADSNANYGSGVNSSRWVLTGIIIIIGALLLLSLSVPVVAGATTSQNSASVMQNADCEPPVTLRDQTHARFDELQELSDDDRVTVSEETMSAIRRQVDAADSSYALTEYCEAQNAYSAASGQLTPALKNAYRRGSIRYLNATAGMVQAELADENPDPDAGSLNTSVQEVSDNVRSAESLDQYRSTFQNSQSLYQSANSQLPTQLHERVVETLLEQSGLVAVTIVITILGAIGAGIAHWYRTRTQESVAIPTAR